MILDPAGRPIGQTLSDEDAIQRAADEMKALDAEPMVIALAPLSAFRLASMLQLALRHPDLPGDLREMASRFLDNVREYFADSPTVTLMLDAGDDPTQDIGGDEDDQADHALDPLNVYPPDERADHDLGPCCICETTIGVRNILMLRHKAPIAGHGWGCVVCNLPHDGAVAVVCDACVGQPLKFACRGYPSADGRIPIAELTGTHEHDTARHRDD